MRNEDTILDDDDADKYDEANNDDDADKYDEDNNDNDNNIDNNNNDKYIYHKQTRCTRVCSINTFVI